VADERVPAVVNGEGLQPVRTKHPAGGSESLPECVAREND
jgi:hypothetical protein